jgi:3-oxoacyl-[acyl-carrier protein] reductase
MPTALITGGRRGIGRGCAYALAEAGFDIVVNDLVEDGAAAETIAGIEKRGRHATFIQADISDLDAHEELIETAAGAFGPIHCLVNNAGVSVLDRGDLLDVSMESYDRCLDTNLRGPFFLTQRVARHMLDQEGGEFRSIITISSVNAEILAVTRGEYCVSKAGMAMMSKLFAVRLADTGIGVYEIRPGIIRTDMTAPARERYDREIADGLTPIRRWGEPEDVGRVAATAATGGLPFSVGQALYVDGGLTLRTF